MKINNVSLAFMSRLYFSQDEMTVTRTVCATPWDEKTSTGEHNSQRGVALNDDDKSNDENAKTRNDSDKSNDENAMTRNDSQRSVKSLKRDNSQRSTRAMTH